MTEEANCAAWLIFPFFNSSFNSLPSPITRFVSPLATSSTGVRHGLNLSDGVTYSQQLKRNYSARSVQV